MGIDRRGWVAAECLLCDNECCNYNRHARASEEERSGCKGYLENSEKRKMQSEEGKIQVERILRTEQGVLSARSAVPELRAWRWSWC